ncbi:MAG: hypothetical protein A3F33_02540 [Candidatus Woykebacteria bacterium RIFCSPHIGHO2_12_FULL_43_10]|nr:MAG: hypothetical protein A3F33_02540 [Candidatus Woykebacteria bacterium RIFCSPHIGHO2_12_FULL_43_10]
MQHDQKATANALAVVGGGLYTLCATWTLLARDSFMGVMNTWAHGIELSTLPSKSPDFGTLFIGLATFVVAAWVTGYAFAVVYNNFAKK